MCDWVCVCVFLEYAEALTNPIKHISQLHKREAQLAVFLEDNCEVRRICTMVLHRSACVCVQRNMRSHSVRRLSLNWLKDFRLLSYKLLFFSSMSPTSRKRGSPGMTVKLLLEIKTPPSLTHSLH